MAAIFRKHATVSELIWSLILQDLCKKYRTLSLSNQMQGLLSTVSMTLVRTAARLRYQDKIDSSRGWSHFVLSPVPHNILKMCFPR
jgi:hypothetical protein